MNQWQKYYIDTEHNGKMPRTKVGKREFEFLSDIKERITVHFPDFNGANGFKPAHSEEYTVTFDDCDMPNGKISVSVLSSNLSLWSDRGYKIETA